MVAGLATSVTIFLTTQYLEEADRLADIAVLDGGRVVADGTSEALKGQVAGQRLDLELADAPPSTRSPPAGRPRGPEDPEAA